MVQEIDTSKVCWHIELETSKGIVYYSTVTMRSLQEFIKTNKNVRNIDAKGVIHKYLFPMILHKHKSEVVRTLTITRSVS